MRNLAPNRFVWSTTCAIHSERYSTARDLLILYEHAPESPTVTVKRVQNSVFVLLSCPS